MSRRVIELGEDQIDRLDLQGNAGADKITFYGIGAIETWALNDASVAALRGACVDEKPVRLYIEVEDDDDE